MEDKNFQWLCRLLATGKVRLNVLETLFFHGDELEFWCHTVSGGTVRKRAAGEDGVMAMADGLVYFLQKAKSSMRKTGTNAACYNVWKGARSVVDASTCEDMVARRETFARCSFLQEYRDLRSPRRCTYAFRSLYSHGRGYSTAAYRTKDTQRERETSTRLIHKMRDYCQVVFSTVEHMKLKRVMDLEMEFMQDEDGDLWLMDCSKCRIAVPALCQQTIPAHVESQSSRRLAVFKQKTKNYEKDGERTLFEGKYVFRRGQLRNQNSNLNSPIKINTPVSSKDSSRTEESHYSEEATDSVPADKTPFDVQSAKTMLWNSVRPAKADRFGNPNFQELLMRSFAKRLGLSPRAADDKEEMQRYMDSVLNPAESDLCTRTQTGLGKLRISVQHADDLPSPTSGLSSDSEGSVDSPSAQASPSDINRLPVLTPKLSVSHLRLSKVEATQSAKHSPKLQSPRSEKAPFTGRKRGVRTPDYFDQFTKSTIKTEFLTPILVQRRARGAATCRQ